MRYKVLVGAEIKSDLQIETIEELLQFALVNSHGNEIITDHKCSSKLSIIEYQEFEVTKISDECMYCGEDLEFRMVDWAGCLEEKLICVDPSCEGNRYYGR